MQLHFYMIPHIRALSYVEDSTLWETLIDRSPSPDVYFRPSYLRLSEIIGGGNAVALLGESGTQSTLCPLLVRREAHVSDAFTPYGYGGLLSVSPGMLSAYDTARIFESIDQWCKSEGLICCVVRMHPLLVNQFDLSSLAPPDFIVQNRGETQAIDLAHWDLKHQRIAGMKKGRLSDLSYARKFLTVVIAEGPDRVKQNIQIFRNIYDETMQRVQAKAFYRFPEAYYQELVKSLGSHAVIGLALHQNRPVAASVFLHDHHFLHYHLSGTTKEGMGLKASTLLVNEAASWARSKGCRMLHLGGGHHKGAGLQNFKASFGGSSHPYIYVTIVADIARYRQLIDAAKPLWPYAPEPKKTASAEV